MAERIFFVGDFVRWNGWNALVSDIDMDNGTLSILLPSGTELCGIKAGDVRHAGDGLSVVQELRAEIDRLSRLYVSKCHETERLEHWRDSLRKAIADDGWFDDG